MKPNAALAQAFGLAIEGLHSFQLDVRPNELPRIVAHYNVRDAAGNVATVVREYRLGLIADRMRDTVAGARATPASYRRAAWHCVLPLDADEGVVGVALRVGASVERYAVDKASAEQLLAALAEALGYGLRSPAGTRPPVEEVRDAA